MNYRLIVVTHGNALALEMVLDTFARSVIPSPAETVVVLDGPARRPRFPRDWTHAPTFVGPREQSGFCSSMRYGWEAAVKPGVDHVFWLENDFVIERSIDLRNFAAVLSASPRLAQMSLMRNAVNNQEKDAGGLYESRRDQYLPQWDLDSAKAVLPIQWLQHVAYFTTNPSLMTVEFMRENPWPDYPSECEGRFGIDLLARGYTFGVWGNGEPWCEHVGVRDGHGY